MRGYLEQVKSKHRYSWINICSSFVAYKDILSSSSAKVVFTSERQRWQVISKVKSKFRLNLKWKLYEILSKSLFSSRMSLTLCM